MFRSFTGFVRTIAGIGLTILVMLILSSFAPDLFWGLVGLIGMVIGWSAPIIFILLFIRSWKLSKKIGMRGPKLRAKFMVLRAFQDVFRGSYNRMVRGDSDTKPELTKAQRLRLLHHDNGLTDQQLKDGLAALKPARRRTDNTEEPATQPAPQQRRVVREEPAVPSRTAPKANRLTQQPPAAPVEEHYEDVPVEIEEPAPAPRPQPRPARQPRPAPRPHSSVNNTPGFGGSIRISGDWGQPKN